MKTTSDRFLIYRLIFLALLSLTLAVTWFSLATPATGAAPALTATPGPTDQASIYWGETLYLLCYEDSTAKAQNQPAGILTFDVTGSDNVRITCRAPGTEGEGMAVELKDATQ